HKSIEKATLGLGRHTARWVEERPAPKGDGEVLVVQFDSKAVPTARDRELKRRRGPRAPRAFPGSPRHRARDRRLQRPSQPRRKKGDKSKNGKATTVRATTMVEHSDDALTRLAAERTSASGAPGWMPKIS
ncbi:MAG: hypothetical protein CSB49_08565, partial [Proteobacteria bacterium]